MSLTQSPCHEVTLTTLGRIVGGYVQNHTLSNTELTQLIHMVYSTLNGLRDRSFQIAGKEPNVAKEDSIQADYLICLEDGRKLKMLKRHLRTTYNLSPEQYRERWGLPLDYPMVAPNYASKRSSLAKSSGLGRKRKSQVYPSLVNTSAG